MSREVRVGIIAGVADVVVALIALFGVLVSVDRSDAANGAGPSSAPAVSATVAATLSCPTIVEQYRRLVLLTPSLLDALVTAGPDGISPVEADPDARRCAVTEQSLDAMR